MATSNSQQTSEDWPEIRERINAGSKINPTLIRRISLRANPVGRESIRDLVKEPTPFPSAQTNPVSAMARSNVTRGFADPQAISCSPPTLDLRATPNNQKSIVETDLANSLLTPIANNLKREYYENPVVPDIRLGPYPSCHNPLHNAQTRSQKGSRLDARRCPPTSFPSNFYQQIEPGPSHAPCRKTTPPVSPRSMPVRRSSLPHVNDGSKKLHLSSSPTPTRYDRRGRPKFYEKIHYFTACPHASPPASRPIGAHTQPRPDPYFYPTGSTLTRSIIPGSCFNCDTQQRRAAEQNVIQSNDELVTDLIHELRYVVEKLELLSPVGTVGSEDGIGEDSDMNKRHIGRLHNNAPDANYGSDMRADVMNSSSAAAGHVCTSTSVNPMPVKEQRRSYKMHLIRRFYTLEARINEIRRAQDDSLTYIWQGYTGHWGIGLHSVGNQRPGFVIEHDVAEVSEQSPEPLECMNKTFKNASESPSEDSEDLEVVTVHDSSDADNENATCTDETSLGSHSGANEDDGKVSAKPSVSPHFAGRTK